MNEEQRLIGLVGLLDVNIPESSRRTIFFEVCKLLGISFSKEILERIEEELKVNDEEDDEDDGSDKLELPEHCPLCSYEIKAIRQLEKQKKPSVKAVKKVLLDHMKKCGAIDTISLAVSGHALAYSLKGGK